MATLFVATFGLAQKASGDGFVLVSGDEVLGWCDHGTYDPNNMPPMLKDMLARYPKPVEVKPRKAVRKVQAAYDVVKPLIKTQWSQWSPYNDQCPKGCPTGCVITAIAQIMNYWQWPETGFGTHTHSGIDVTIDYSKRHYDWKNMEQPQNVAQLMLDLGVAFDAAYKPDGTSCSGLAALGEHFRYKPDFKRVSADIESYMMSELEAGRPLYYDAQPDNPDPLKENTGHALICDGYNSDRYFHFNYGWGGQYDGYYSLGLLYKYNRYPGVVGGIMPDNSLLFDIGSMSYAVNVAGEAELRECKLQSGDVTIPDEVTHEGKTYPVTRIATNAFPANKKFGTIKIGNNVREIAPKAFIAVGINTLVIGDKVEDVGDQAFAASGIRTLTIGKSVKRIGKQAFYANSLNTVNCYSEAFEVDDDAMGMTQITDGEWLKNITKLGEGALAGTKLSSPVFGKLVEVGPVALGSLNIVNVTFPKTLRHISPDAFKYSRVYGVTIDKENPWLCTNGYETVIMNKAKTSVEMTVNIQMWDGEASVPEGVLKMKNGSVAYNTTHVKLPATIIDVDGAFSNAKSLTFVTCKSTEPPVLTDASFPDEIFERNTWLIVPKGCYDAYSKAPGWRRFKDIQDYLEDVPETPAPQMTMTVHRPDGVQSVDMTEVKNMSLTENALIVNGQETWLGDIDSLTWNHSFQYDAAETFTVNDSVRTAEAQSCTVTLDEAVLGDDATLSVRSSLVCPLKVPGSRIGEAVEVCLTDKNGKEIHELSGTMEIRIPLALGEDEAAGAVWYNHAAGRWDPVNGTYDAQTGEMVIKTNHLSTFEAFTIADKNTRAAKLVRGYIPDSDTPLSEVARNMQRIVSDPLPLTAAADFYANDVSTMTQLGNDFTFNALQSLGLESEMLGDFSKSVGQFGTLWSIYQVCRASYQGADEQVAGGTLKLMLGKALEIAGDLLSSSIMSASMASVAFIDYSLNRFAQEAWSGRKDIYKAGFDLYYSKKGREIANPAPGKGFRTAPDWFNLFYPVIKKGALDAQGLQKWIDDEVTKYCREYWEDEDAQTFCMTYAHDKMGYSYGGGLNSKIMNELSEELRGNLYNGTLVSVFRSIKQHRENDAYDEASQYFDDYIDWMNRVVHVKISDSKLKDGKSEYAGFKVRFKDVPLAVKDPELWECTLDEKGAGHISFRLFAYLDAGFKPTLVLVNAKDEELLTYDFTMDKSGKYVMAKIDLNEGGVEVPAEDGWKYEITPLYAVDEDGKDSDLLYADDVAQGINKALSVNRNLVIAKDGSFSINEEGVKISGNIDVKSHSGSGTFTLDTQTDFVNEISEEEIFDFYASVFVKDQELKPAPRTIIKAFTAKHQISGTVTVGYSEKAQQYVLRFVGEGPFTLNGERYTTDSSVWVWDEKNQYVVGYTEKKLDSEPVSVPSGTIKMDCELLYE